MGPRTPSPPHGPPEDKNSKHCQLECGEQEVPETQAMGKKRGFLSPLPSSGQEEGTPGWGLAGHVYIVADERGCDQGQPLHDRIALLG